jgi:hypothetical protein
MTKRRGRGEGGIRKRSSDGRWEASISLGWESGKRKRKLFYGRTRAEVAQQLRRAQHGIDMGQTPTDGRLTTGSFCEGWLRDTLPGSVQASTVDNYRDVLTHYVLPHIGRVPLAALAPEDVQAMLRALEAQGLSVRTRRLARAVLRRAFARPNAGGKPPATRRLSSSVHAALIPPPMTLLMRPVSVPSSKPPGATDSKPSQCLPCLSGCGAVNCSGCAGRILTSTKGSCTAASGARC